MLTSKKKDTKSKYQELVFEDHRPWGQFRSYPLENISSIKIITVNPGESLSLQYHNHRDEYWIVLDKGLEITVGNKIWKPSINEEIFIPEKTPHRLRGIGKKPARILEFWLGDSNEKDIIRLEDTYGRK
ncbi:MAG: phosphomannose isomerase type II C-terminal cupin domain [Candidatus Aminicenantes bacterium]|nr:phosphomannose isomerase type II C-terminal cupin domain [Candidatus Aminicenantes bacterium]